MESGFTTPNARYASRQRRTNAEIMANKQKMRNEQEARYNTMITSSPVFQLKKPPPPRRPEGWQAPNYAPPPKSGVATRRVNRRNLRRSNRRSLRKNLRRSLRK